MTERDIFIAALQKESSQRQAYLAEACVGQPALQEQVRDLLKLYENAGSFLQRPFVEPTATVDEPITERPGTVIGPYKLLEQIGEGGFGVVFLAEQSQPVQRKVALKVLKPGMDTRQVVGRFEAERQTLAIMDHPNIAKVFDGGTTASSRPYFVMELVQGIPITEFCDQHQLTPRQRLELFVSVCHAVQHAHQKGIIHRDLKPSNVLVTVHDSAPVVKIIDFGVAKALGHELRGQSLFTGFAQMIGTPLYMSPEQAGMSDLDIDTRSDIYSLGVLLYELLTGTTPFNRERFQKAAYDEILRIIREEEPPRPSTRLSASQEARASMSTQRQTEPAKLTKLVRGELDWIVMKALEKDRNRRYETAIALSEDIGRYMHDEPVRAGPPSRWYRLRKFVRRNRGPVLAACLVLLTLVAGVAGTSWGMVRAFDERDAKERARQEAADNEVKSRAAQASAEQSTEEARAAEANALAFTDFVVKRVLAVPRTEQVQFGLGPDATIARALEVAEKHLAEDFAGRPRAEATVRNALGVTWRHYYRFPEAEMHLRRAVALREQELGPDHVDTLQSRNSLGALLTEMGCAAEAIPLLEATLAKRQATLGPADEGIVVSMNNLARAYMKAGQLDKAVPLLELTVEKSKTRPEISRAYLLGAMTNLAEAHQGAGRPDKAVPLLEETSIKERELYGPDHDYTLASLAGLARAYLATGQSDKAFALLDEFVADARRRLRPNEPKPACSLTTVGRELLKHALYGAAERVLGPNQQLWEERLPSEWGQFDAQALLGRTLFGQGRYAEAEPLLVEGYEGMKRKAPVIPERGRFRLRETAEWLVQLYEATGRDEKAARWRKELDAWRISRN
jgi:serine/threonine protein kinase/tetratricopeptide (TPR) repeat protein